MMVETLDTERFFRRIVSAKASAKNARDEEDWQGAIDILEQWIDRIQDAKREIAPRATGRMNAELADLYGLVGGTQRRRGLQLQGSDRQSHLAASIRAYDKGFTFEQDLNAKDATT